MGADYTAHAVVGVRILGSDIAGTVGTKPSCDHPQRIGNTFCPVCGTRVGETEVDDHEYEDVLRTLLPKGMEVFQPGSSEDEVPDFLAGIGLTCRHENDEPDPLPVPDAAATRAALRAALEPHGLWDETQFGLHAALYVSV